MARRSHSAGRGLVVLWAHQRAHPHVGLFVELLRGVDWESQVENRELELRPAAWSGAIVAHASVL